MNKRGNGRRARKRVTGRFYAFLVAAVAIVVLVAVLIANRGGAPAPVGPATPAVTATPAPDGPSSIEDMMGDEMPIAPEDLVKVSDLSVKEGLSSEWRNMLLLGTDTRNVDKVERTDTIMIASVNAKAGRVKLISIMRDLVVPYQTGAGAVKDVKINSLIGRGGPELVMKTVNELFGMNITEYVMVNFASFQKAIDILGGIELDITEEEMNQVNVSLGEMARTAGYEQQWYLDNKDSLKLTQFGEKTHLTGIQALGYARIRHVGNSDYQRTERQRLVLEAVLRKVRSDAGIAQIMQLAAAMWTDITTNVNLGVAVSLATDVIKNGAMKLDQSARIPGVGTSFKSETRSGLGAALYDCDFEANAKLLYDLIYTQ